MAHLGGIPGSSGGGREAEEGWLVGRVLCGHTSHIGGTKPTCVDPSSPKEIPERQVGAFETRAFQLKELELNPSSVSHSLRASQEVLTPLA